MLSVMRYVSLARMTRISPVMTERARALRNGATEAERLVWRRLSGVRPRFT